MLIFYTITGAIVVILLYHLCVVPHKQSFYIVKHCIDLFLYICNKYGTMKNLPLLKCNGSQLSVMNSGKKTETPFQMKVATGKHNKSQLQAY